MKATLWTVLVTLAAASPAWAVITPLNSGARAYFGSQGTTYMDADPITVFTPASPIGPYTPGSPLPNLPAPPVSPQYPAVSGIPFQPAGYTFNFNDNFGGTTQFTAATTTIDHAFNPIGTSTSDAEIIFPNWRFEQGPAAPSYAYEQVNFVAQYLANTSLSASTPVFPLFINGGTSGLGTPFVQIDAAITYTWIPVDSSLNVNGPATTLGTLNYSWQAVGGGPFSTVVFSTGALAATPGSFGVLELTGYAYVTGDPFEINISSTPEPGTLSVLAISGIALLRRRRPMAPVGRR